MFTETADLAVVVVAAGAVLVGALVLLVLGRARWPEEHTRLPVVFGPYRLVELLGSGGMGCVFRSVRGTRDCPYEVAVKVPKRKLVASAEERRRWRSEVRGASGLHHPGVVRVQSSGEIGGVPYLEMELLEGVPLASLLGSLSEGQAAWVAREVALALAWLDQRQVVHRDICPNNVFLTAQGQVKVLDFGILAVLGPGNTHLTLTAWGKSPYMAPECSGEVGRFSPASDVYAWGVLFHELLTGKLPGPFVPAPVGRAGRLIEAAVARDRSARPTAASLAGDLQALADPAGIVALVAGRSATKRPGAEGLPPPPPSFPPAAGRAAAGLAVLAGLGTLGWAVLPGQPSVGSAAVQVVRPAPYTSAVLGEVQLPACLYTMAAPVTNAQFEALLPDLAVPSLGRQAGEGDGHLPCAEAPGPDQPVVCATFEEALALARAASAAEGLGGDSAWRLPRRGELASLPGAKLAVWLDDEQGDERAVDQARSAPPEARQDYIHVWLVRDP